MKVSKVEILDALEKVKPGLARKELIEQSTSFAFIEGQVVTYNDEISVSHPVRNLDITGAVKAEVLYELLSKIRQDEIEIECSKQQLKVKADRSVASIVMEHEVKLPLGELGTPRNWKKLPEGTIDALAFCYPCCSTDMSQPVLTCVHVRKDIVEASDSYQIVRYRLGGEIKASEFLLPSTAVKELVKYKVEEIAQSQGWAHFRTADGTIFSSRISEGMYPDTEQFLEVTGTTVDLPGVRHALEKAQVFARSDFHTNHIPVVTLEVSDGKARVLAKNEHGSFESVSKARHKGDAVRITTGAEFLANMLAKVRTCTIGDRRIKFEGNNWIYVAVTMAEEDETR